MTAQGCNQQNPDYRKPYTINDHILSTMQVQGKTKEMLGRSFRLKET